MKRILLIIIALSPQIVLGENNLLQKTTDLSEALKIISDICNISLSDSAYEKIINPETHSAESYQGLNQYWSDIIQSDTICVYMPKSVSIESSTTPLTVFNHSCFVSFELGAPCVTTQISAKTYSVSYGDFNIHNIYWGRILDFDNNNEVDMCDLFMLYLYYGDFPIPQRIINNESHAINHHNTTELCAIRIIHSNNRTLFDIYERISPNPNVTTNSVKTLYHDNKK